MESEDAVSSAEGLAAERADLARWARRAQVLTVVLVAIGIALRVWQYAADTSLGSDELSIARHIHERSLATLMQQPLGSDQIAPLGFLASVKICTLLFGESDLALRLFPFLCGIAGLLLFWRAALRVLSGPAVPIAVGFYAIAIPLIRYSAELMPYGLDIVATLVLTLVALDLRERDATVWRCLLAGVVGLVIALFSQTAVLVMVGLSAALIGCWLFERNARALRPVLITVPMWLLASVVGWLIARRYAWQSQGGFAPWDGIVQYFADPQMLRYPLPALFAAMTIVGFALLWRRRDVALVLTGPLVVTLVAATLHAYPVGTPVVLFLLPSVLIALAEFLDVVLTLSTSVHPRLGVLAMVALAGPSIYVIALHPPPYH